MKRTFCLLLLITLLLSCSKDTPVEPGVEPTVVATSLTDGATEVSIDLGTITLRYSTPVVLSGNASISLDGNSITTETANTTMTISFGALDYGTEYTLKIPAGAVINKADKTPAKAFSLQFTTETKVMPPYNPTEPGDYSQNLAMKNPIANATALYKYLLSIYGTNTLSGAMAKIAWNTDEAQWIHTWTSRWPAVAYFDYIHLNYSPTDWIDYSDISPIKEWWDAKGLVGASWHWMVPPYEGCTDNEQFTCSPDLTTFKASNVTVEGTWENIQAKADLDKIASYLLLLQAENIPVIWRPMHEAAGNIYTQWHSGAWFWWGNDGAEAFKKLWIFVFDYLQNKGVRNLIWVWTTQTSTFEDTDYYFYPGDDYVDIVGKDIYDNTSPSDIFSQFKTVTHMTSHKMATLSENGRDSNMDEQWNAGAKWLFFMPWYDNDNDWTEDFAHDFATIGWWKESFKNPAVLDRSGIPSDLFPEWTDK